MILCRHSQLRHKVGNIPFQIAAQFLRHLPSPFDHRIGSSLQQLRQFLRGEPACRIFQNFLCIRPLPLPLSVDDQCLRNDMPEHHTAEIKKLSPVAGVVVRQNINYKARLKRSQKLLFQRNTPDIFRHRIDTRFPIQ